MDVWLAELLQQSVFCSRVQHLQPLVPLYHSIPCPFKYLTVYVCVWMHIPATRLVGVTQQVKPQLRRIWISVSADVHVLVCGANVWMWLCICVRTDVLHARLWRSGFLYIRCDAHACVCSWVSMWMCLCICGFVCVCLRVSVCVWADVTVCGVWVFMEAERVNKQRAVLFGSHKLAQLSQG